MNLCAKQRFDSTESKMNKIYSECLKLLSKRAKEAREDSLNTGDEQVDSIFVLSQQKWLDYRKSNCKTYEVLYFKASMRPMVLSNCYESLTSERIQQLEALLEEINQN